MTYLGDFAIEATFDLKFTTVNTAGVPTTLAGSPVISIYPGNSVTEITAGITLSVDFDSRTGMHNVRVVATAANGYATATNYAVVITTGTVAGSSVVGYVVGHFSIEARSGLRPTVAARTLDVSAGGEAGIDWANIGSPTTAQNLSATNIDVDQVVASVSGAVGSVTGAVGSVGAGGITATSIADNAIDTATFAAGTTIPRVTLADSLTTYTGNTPQTGDSFARIGAPAGASVSADIAAIESQTDDIGVAGAGLTAITSKTDNLPSDPADQSLIIAATNAIVAILGTPAGASLAADIAVIESQTDDIGVAGAGLTALGDARLANLDATISSRLATAGYTVPPTTAENADKLLGRNLAGGSDGGRTVKDALRILRNKRSIAAGTLTVTAEDDTTPAWTATVATAVSNPVNSVDPA